MSDDLEVALLGPDVVPRFPGQAVFSTSCGALIQVSFLPVLATGQLSMGGPLLLTHPKLSMGRVGPCRAHIPSSH